MMIDPVSPSSALLNSAISDQHVANSSLCESMQPAFTSGSTWNRPIGNILLPSSINCKSFSSSPLLSVTGMSSVSDRCTSSRNDSSTERASLLPVGMASSCFHGSVAPNSIGAPLSPPMKSMAGTEADVAMERNSGANSSLVPKKSDMAASVSIVTSTGARAVSPYVFSGAVCLGEVPPVSLSPPPSPPDDPPKPSPTGLPKPLLARRAVVVVVVLMLALCRVARCDEVQIG
mmetsp:Transcript_16311/g.36214  ORF Transcript_16311/g.36214 Transcript_16311/m.36214 type:complete len:232 (-) Transcript_16311:141-836(-)